MYRASRQARFYIAQHIITIIDLIVSSNISMTVFGQL